MYIFNRLEKYILVGGQNVVKKLYHEYCDIIDVTNEISMDKETSEIFMAGLNTFLDEKIRYGCRDTDESMRYLYQEAMKKLGKHLFDS